LRDRKVYEEQEDREELERSFPNHNTVAIPCGVIERRQIDFRATNMTWNVLLEVEEM